MPKPTHPMQPIVIEDGIVRFKENAIVRFFLDESRERGGPDLNTIERLPFTREDRVQFAQIIGYSVSGFGDLRYVPRDVVEKADAAAKLITDKRG